MCYKSKLKCILDAPKHSWLINRAHQCNLFKSYSGALTWDHSTTVAQRRRKIIFYKRLRLHYFGKHIFNILSEIGSPVASQICHAVTFNTRGVYLFFSMVHHEVTVLAVNRGKFGRPSFKILSASAVICV